MSINEELNKQELINAMNRFRDMKKLYLSLPQKYEEEKIELKTTIVSEITRIKDNPVFDSVSTSDERDEIESFLTELEI